VLVWPTHHSLRKSDRRAGHQRRRLSVATLSFLFAYRRSRHGGQIEDLQAAPNNSRRRTYGKEHKVRNSDTFDRAIAAFSVAYADQNERDHAALERAVSEGKVKAVFEEDK